MPLILGTNSIKDTGYNVANSLRFNESDDCLIKTFGSGGNRKKWTFSLWFKRGKLGGSYALFVAGTSGNDEATIRIEADKIDWQHYDVGTSSQDAQLLTSQVLRDPSAWYNLQCVYDSANATAGDRMKMFLNGSEITSFSTDNNPSLNYDSAINNNVLHNIGRQSWNNSADFSGYMAEICFIDGQALDPTSFGEFDEDTGIWKPIDVSGLTFGTNGFYLDFENSGSLGADVSGNGNNFTVNNLTSIDQTTDTCTNNYCTLNPLDPTADITLSEGNLKGVYGTSGTRDIQGSTFGVSSGKWYWEIKIGGASDPNNAVVGVTQLSTDNNVVLGEQDVSWGYRGYDGAVFHNNSSVASYSTFDGTSIIGIYLDLDNHKLYFSKDGSLQSSTGISLDTAQDYFPAIADAGSSATPQFEMNFGAGTTFSISSGNTDGEYGNFEYSTTITGDGASKTFKALNTKNLSEYG